MSPEEYARACEAELATITDADVIADLNARVPPTVSALAHSLATLGPAGAFVSNSQDMLATAVYFANAYLDKVDHGSPDHPPEAQRLHRALVKAINAYRDMMPLLLAVRRVRERQQAAEQS